VSKLLGQPYKGWILENGLATLIEELGLLGPILWIIWSASLVFSASRIVGQLRRAEVFPVALAILWFAWLVLFWYTWVGIQGYQNFVNNAYLWLLVGILFSLPRLAGQNSAARRPAADTSI
jgi:CDP-diglyceride synthetase